MYLGGKKLRKQESDDYNYWDIDYSGMNESGEDRSFGVTGNKLFRWLVTIHMFCFIINHWAVYFCSFFLHVFYISQFLKDETIDQIPFEANHHIGNNIYT